MTSSSQRLLVPLTMTAEQNRREPRRHLIRFYGWYSNVTRGRLAGRRRAGVGVAEVPATPQAESATTDPTPE